MKQQWQECYPGKYPQWNDSYTPAAFCKSAHGCGYGHELDNRCSGYGGDGGEGWGHGRNGGGGGGGWGNSLTGWCDGSGDCRTGAPCSEGVLYGADMLDVFVTVQQFEVV